MKTLIALSALAALAGCATTDNTYLAQNECKVAPITTMSATGVRKSQPDSLDQRYAEMQLGTSDYRYRNLRLLIQGKDRLFLVPSPWSRGEATLVLPLDDAVRIQFVAP